MSTTSTSESNTALVIAIVACMDGWTVLPDSIKQADRYPAYVRSHFNVKHEATGLELWFNVSPYGKAGRIFIGHVRPRNAKNEFVRVYDDKHAEVSAPEITVSMSKKPEQIAKDIDRRLLPDVRRVQELVHAKIKAENAFYDGKEGTIQEIANLVGLVNHDSRDRSQINVFAGIKDPYNRIGYGDARVNSADSIDLDLKSLKPGLAKAIIRVIREHAEKLG